MATHLEEIYMKDSLTGLYNKAGFDYYKEKLLSGSEPGSFLSVLFVDMNGLKKINDEFGHDSGDFSIKVLGQAISQALDTEASLAGRIGGDEFNIILRGGEEEAEALKKKITSYLTNYGKLNPGKFAITASIGVSTAKLTSAFALSDLIREADAKMYEEKKNRRS
jgi:diguanylate cyclase (GGDEF)-like protein